MMTTTSFKFEHNAEWRDNHLANSLYMHINILVQSSVSYFGFGVGRSSYHFFWASPFNILWVEASL